MMLKILKCSKPKNYKCLNLIFPSVNSANNYVKNIKEDFLLKKAKMLEPPLSKRKQKIIKFSEPNKYILTRIGNKLLLWGKY